MLLRQTLSYRTDQLPDLRKLERLNRSLMLKMMNRKEPEPGSEPAATLAPRGFQRDFNVFRTDVDLLAFWFYVNLFIRRLATLLEWLFVLLTATTGTGAGISPSGGKKGGTPQQQPKKAGKKGKKK